MRAASARSAAMRKAVAPCISSPDAVWGGRLPRSRRRFTSAPSATRVRTNCRLVRLPAPSGAGSPRSLASGFRTQLTVCSGAKPVRWSLGSAPALISSTASSKWPLRTASSSGLMPSSTGR